ncbi:MAG: ABC transporter substrate-binding protein [Chloroflexi bacterium]|nr:ABC transporter substrate-binding protein [Chloroflexota bacterium]
MMETPLDENIRKGTTLMTRKITFFILLSLLLVSCRTVAAPAPQELTPVTLPVGYIPNVQFAPFYVAIEKGFYRDQGLDVSMDYNMETDSVALIGAGDLDFAIVSGEQVLLGRAQELPVVYVMAWYQQFPVGVAALADSGIQAPADLAGKQVGIPGLYGASYIGLRALLYASGLQESDLTLDSIGYTQIEALLNGMEDAVVIYVSNEPIKMAAEGYQVNVLPVSDALALVANGLITSESVITDHPDLVRGMVTATLQGIAYTSQHPDEAFEICKQYVDTLASLTPTELEVQRQVLEASIPMFDISQNGITRLSAWQNMQDVLLEMGLLTQPLTLEDAFTNQFIPAS